MLFHTQECRTVHHYTQDPAGSQAAGLVGKCEASLRAIAFAPA